jgi:hypothetical protein
LFSLSRDSQNYRQRIFLTENVVVGDLVIRPDKTFGGGALNLSGKFWQLMQMN